MNSERFNTHVLRLIPLETKVLVAYSGGADSTTLLLLMHGAGYDVVACHLHHGMRVEADQELLNCQGICDSIGVPFASGRADVPKISTDRNISIEEAGRQARYAFFAQVKASTGCEIVVTGHTADDQLETVLHHLIRGSGLKGICGIPEIREDIVRPLLPFSREETREFCTSRGLWFHDDPDNFNLKYTRVKLREKVVPELLKINPTALESVRRMTTILREEDAYLDSAAAAFLETIEFPLNDQLAFLTRSQEFGFTLSGYRSGPAVLAKRSLKLLLSFFGGQPSFDQILDLDDSLRTLESGGKSLGEEIEIQWTPERAIVFLNQSTEPYRHVVTLPGETLADSLGWKFEAEPWPKNDFKRQRNSLEVIINNDAIKGQIFFRSMQTGDKIQPLGMEGSKLVSDLLQEAKLTHLARKSLPILCDLVGPFWIPGIALSERVKIKEDTNSAIRLSFCPF